MGSAAKLSALFLVVSLAAMVVHGQEAEEEPIGIGDIRLGASLSTLPFPCGDPAVCEASYQSAWIRAWHADGVIQRIDVVYSEKTAPGQEEVEASPITLAQAVKTHSIWNGRLAPRLGFAGNIGAQRLIVDFANGVAYLANGVTAESRVSEVRYLPTTDPAVTTASNSMLAAHGKWLIQAAWAAERYRNPPSGQKTGEPNAHIAEEQSTRLELRRQLQNMSQTLLMSAKATLTLSEHVSQSLKNKEKPDPDVSANLKKAYARLTASAHEALDFLSDHAGVVTQEDVEALPLDLAGQAEERMGELLEEGFSD